MARLRPDARSKVRGAWSNGTVSVSRGFTSISLLPIVEAQWVFRDVDRACAGPHHDREREGADVRRHDLGCGAARQ
jgi:hypothetical protein